MGILSFLTASRLKAELTRQRDEIARMHQMLDLEVAGVPRHLSELDPAVHGARRIVTGRHCFG